MKRFLTMCAGILLICQFTPPLTLAQNAGYEVKGVVVDKSGMPILGATVVEKGTTNGVSTGIDGDYAIRAAGPESVIEVSYVGYKTVSLVASSSLLAHLTLEEDAMGIDDVVVIGYGTVKKNDMTGSVVAIKAEEFNRGAVVSTQDMLKGKVPGVHIIPGDGGPGSSATIRVRGAASLNASNDPLIVIDGVHATVSSRSAPSKVFPFSGTCSPCSWLCALHRSFSSRRSALLHCSLCPSSKLTELTIKCVWIWSLSLWVATSTSNPFHAGVFSASCKAFLCACSGVIFSSLW